MAVDVAIIGGGIAGLATAYELSRQRRSFVVLEQAPRAGGVIVSEEVGGFTIDGGPDALLIQKPAAIALCEELGLGGRLGTTKPPRIAYVQRRGRLYPLPAASVLGIPTGVRPFVETRLFTWPGKMRMGAELFVPRRDRDDDESIGSFMRRRFGNEATTFPPAPLHQQTPALPPAAASHRDPRRRCRPPVHESPVPAPCRSGTEIRQPP